jgi:3',5'-cyclic AMP phosphodiesterase CpdA
MKRLVWLTDIHLNFLTPVQMEKFFSAVKDTRPDGLLISGDIGEAPRLSWYLRQLEDRFQCPIYFVLGNHDYYMASIADVRAAVGQQVSVSRWLTWMNEAGMVELSSHTVLIGHDSWADGRCGDYARSDVMMNDYVVIRELANLTKSGRLRVLNRLGDEAAAYFREWLPKALEKYPNVLLLTHVPPFRDACWHEGQISDDNWLPHFVCKAAGDVLVEVMQKHPMHQLTVLCGHSHGQGTARILDNLFVQTGGAEYGRIDVQQVIVLPD